MISAPGMALAGALHLVAAVRHLDLNPVAATGLAAAGFLQIAGARAVRVGRPRATSAVMALTASLVVLVLTNHTVGTGLVFGDADPHPAGRLGWATLVVQVLTVASWVCSAGWMTARGRFSSVATAALLLGGLTAAALPPQLQHGQHHDGASQGHDDHGHGDDHHR